MKLLFRGVLILSSVFYLGPFCPGASAKIDKSCEKIVEKRVRSDSAYQACVITGEFPFISSIDCVRPSIDCIRPEKFINSSVYCVVDYSPARSNDCVTLVVMDPKCEKLRRIEILEDWRED